MGGVGGVGRSCDVLCMCRGSCLSRLLSVLTWSSVVKMTLVTAPLGPGSCVIITEASVQQSALPPLWDGGVYGAVGVCGRGHAKC